MEVRLFVTEVTVASDDTSVVEDTDGASSELVQFLLEFGRRRFDDMGLVLYGQPDTQQVCGYCDHDVDA